MIFALKHFGFKQYARVSLLGVLAQSARVFESGKKVSFPSFHSSVQATRSVLNESASIWVISEQALLK
jgi:hypothetical protein